MPENGSGNDIDHLQISIEANAGKAASGIDRLAEALGKLKTQATGFNVNFGNLSQELKAFANINLAGVSATINSIVKLGKNIGILIVMTFVRLLDMSVGMILLKWELIRKLKKHTTPTFAPFFLMM